MDKLRSTLKQFVRDWSTEVSTRVPLKASSSPYLDSHEGEQEREACYKPMKDALLQYYSHVPKSRR